MTSRARTAVLALWCSGCATTVVPLGEFRAVRDHAMSAFTSHEECLDVEAGDRLEYIFESTEPLHFDIHYREGSAMVLPIARDDVQRDAAVYPILESRRLCLGWEAGAAGARIDYRFRLRRSAP